MYVKAMLSIAFSVAALAGCGEGGAGGPGEESAEAKLQQLAMKELFDSKYSLAGPGSLCDKVEDAKLVDVRIGTISRSSITGDFASPLPAIVARHDYVCVINALAKREHYADQWVVLGIDDEFGMIRCMRTGPKNIVDEVAQRCGFKVGG
ncbi:hypothetical protein A11A3_16410 [Alcanivorax hongdengensis A-11-3]|uniref:Lipoprotein n=1 Tax=Alcanivorax hongdengensis A-11-3 TaxID=1177179 RepID=L0W7M8_9GAMM|nr:hypothetical protein [Alcanivorax hongdengensis]EKF72881.1 hypothetical protein A11A3_16410 [Alcanivorax hongdengensis A-11-3]